MAHHQSNIALGHLRSSLPIPLLSPSSQSSIYSEKLQNGGEESEGEGGSSWAQQSYLQLTQPTSSFYSDRSYHNVPRISVRFLEPQLVAPSAICFAQNSKEFPVPFTLSPPPTIRALASTASQKKVTGSLLDHGYPQVVRNTPCDGRAPTLTPQQDRREELLPPVDLAHISSLEDLEAGALRAYDPKSCRKHPSGHSMQKHIILRAERYCKELCISTDHVEDAVPGKDDVEHIAGPNRFDSGSAYEEMIPNLAVEELCFIFPQRKLSYNEQLQVSESKSLHRAAGCRELRRAVDREISDDDCAPWVRQILKIHEKTAHRSTEIPKHHESIDCLPKLQHQARHMISLQKITTPNTHASSSSPLDHTKQIIQSSWAERTATQAHSLNLRADKARTTGVNTKDVHGEMSSLDGVHIEEAVNIP